jgi:bifunctional oligoribonuclease and PAP phosphatase NrnA
LIKCDINHNIGNIAKIYKGREMLSEDIVTSINNKIDKATKILLLTHLNPDADTLGSATAMYDMLWRRQKKVFLFNASEEVSHNLLMLDHSNKLQKKLPVSYDLAISFDCGALERLGVTSLDCELINIDHHVSNESYGDINVIQTECVSATQVVYNLFKASKWKISDKAAQSLYSGLVSDSLAFGTDRVTHEVFMMAADLVNCGASAEKARNMLFEQNSLAKVKLSALMLQALSLSHDAKVGSIFATREMFETTGAKSADTEEALRAVMSMGVVDSVVMLREEKDGQIKASLRSKGLLDMNHIASKFNGGGHIRASGFTTKDSLENVSKKVLDIITKEIV